MKERTKKDGTKQIGISVFMQPALHQQLKTRAKELDIPITLLIRQAAQAFLDAESINDGSLDTSLDHLNSTINHLANSVDQLNGQLGSAHISPSI